MIRNYLIVFTIIFSNSCTFLKSDIDHKNFIENKLKENYKQDSFYEPNFIDESNYEKFSSYYFVNYLQPKRTGDGTFLTKAEIYRTYLNYENCQLPYPGMPGYVYTDRYGSRVKSILKKPIGEIEIRTAYDGENFYIINLSIINKEDDKDYKDEKTWNVIKELKNLPCR
jgi:hypothetical protein